MLTTLSPASLRVQRPLSLLRTYLFFCRLLFLINENKDVQMIDLTKDRDIFCVGACVSWFT